MKRNLVLFLATLCLFFSCKKDDHGTAPVPPPVTDSTKTGSININLSTSNRAEEIIISETGGKVLLDTMSPYPNALVATLKTNQTLVDFTVVYYDSVDIQYQIKTYKGVNPSKWLTVGAQGYNLGTTTTSVTANVVYKNVPVAYNPIWFADYIGVGAGFSYPPGYIVVNYEQLNPANYVYLRLGPAGLYNFHIPPQGMNDTVDLSHMDTTIKLNFNLPATFTLQSTNLNGVMDTTDFSKSLWLFSTQSGVTWDLEYPGKLVQKMELNVSGTNSTNDYAFYYSYGDTISPTLPLLGRSAYTLSSTQFNNFTEQFTTVHPSYYYTEWQAGKIYYQLYASPDSTNLNPQALLTSLNSKILQGQALSGLSLSTFYFENATGLDYADFFSYVHNPTQLKSERVSSSVMFAQSF
jgi:hypothetical protein